MYKKVVLENIRNLALSFEHMPVRNDQRSAHLFMFSVIMCLYTWL